MVIFQRRSERHGRSEHRGLRQADVFCLLCGAKTTKTARKPAKVICLICRAAILDRVFQARQQQKRGA
jgi:hypothetical protein